MNVTLFPFQKQPFSIADRILMRNHCVKKDFALSPLDVFFLLCIVMA